MSKTRVVYADLLRICAIFAVIILHVSASQWRHVDITSFDWKVFNFYDSLVRFCVPVFIMLSGMFFLDKNKDINIKNIYNKYIFRIVTAFIFWSILYTVYLKWNNFKNMNLISFKDIAVTFVIGRYHLWFLYMIIGLYIITPILRTFVQKENKHLIEYFLILALIFGSIVPTIQQIVDLPNFNKVLKSVNLNFVLGYVGYYVGGYYLKTYNTNKKINKLIYFTGLISFIFTVTFSYILSISKGSATSTLYENYTPNVASMSIAIFLFFRENISKITFNEKTVKYISKLSSYTFGIYLVHDFFNVLFLKVGLVTTLFNPVVSVPCISILIFVFSLGVVYIIKKIPIINKYIL